MYGNNFEEINWNLVPWSFPKSLDSIIDYGSSSFFTAHPYRTMELWSKEQIKNIIKNKI